MEQIVVQTEVQPDGNILLFYVDENQHIDPSLLEQVEDESIEAQPDTKYIIEDTGGDSDDEFDIAQATEYVLQEQWPDSEISRLIVFYTDNKKTFQNGTTKSKHLWAVACKTMLTERNPVSCEIKFRMLKTKYIQVCLEKQKDRNFYWKFYDLCHQAFYDDPDVLSCLSESSKEQEIQDTETPSTHIVKKDGVIIVKKINNQPGDEKVEAMLKLYMKHKTVLNNANIPKSIWESIALELGEEDGSYWHRRFYNLKKHYISTIHKKRDGNEHINWPYLHYFDKIYANDKDFKSKYLINDNNNEMEVDDIAQNVWYDTHKVFLAKYYFDCFHEFQDTTIPDSFLWHEVGRLLDKEPDSCRKKLEELKENHLGDLLKETYDLNNRSPIQILLDNAIAKEIEFTLTRSKVIPGNDSWNTEDTDSLVQYLYDNMDMLKDLVCYYVCWAVIAKKLDKTVLLCKKKWNELIKLYRTILNNKKENPDMQIDWRYITIFDVIFDYGMDLKLLNGYETSEDSNKSSKPSVNKITFNDNSSGDEESYDERGFTKSKKKQAGDEKAFKLLEYYLKNKDKFSSSQKKIALWDVIGKQIGIPATECAHRFRNLKQVYTAYVQREVNKPEMPILWPYYSLCKKVFGYRAIKSKLKNGKTDADEIEDWSAKEIKQIINHFSTYYSEITENAHNESIWLKLAKEMNRSATSLRDKFLELRKSYRKLKTMKNRIPEVKLTWKYFNMMDNVHNQATQISTKETITVEIPQSFDEIGKTELPDDDDYQCIIVMPEDEEVVYDENLLENQQFVPKTETHKLFKWNKYSKKQLLILYLKCLKRNLDRNISPDEIWNEVASEMDNKTPKACKNMFVKLKNNHKGNQPSQYSKLLDRILALKKIKKEVISSENYLDLEMSDEKVVQALNYYLENIEDFVTANIDKTNAWHELAAHVNESIETVVNKINYLISNNNDDSKFSDILNEIRSRQNELLSEPALNIEDSDNNWSDIELERLLTWYLAHLDKFKNPASVTSYLWMEASDILKKSPLACSKKMVEIRSQYRNMARQNPKGLQKWRFYKLCERIYGSMKV